MSQTVAIPCHNTRSGARQMHQVDPITGARTPMRRWFVSVERPTTGAGLAGFLAEHGSPNTHRYGCQARLTLHGAETQAEALRREARERSVAGGVWFADPARAAERAEQLIACYGLSSRRVLVEDYAWPLIGDDETPAAYFGRVAAQLEAMDVVGAVIHAPGAAPHQWGRAA